MILILPIREEILDMLEELNNGVRPLVDKENPAYFVYKGKDEVPEIVAFTDMFERSASWDKEAGVDLRLRCQPEPTEETSESQD